MQQLMWRMLAVVMMSLTSIVTAQAVEPVCLDGQLRLPAGSFARYCYNGEWRLICHHDSDWNQQRTNDACTQLGYTSRASHDPCVTFSTTQRVVTVTNCTGSGLTQCTVTPSDTCTTCSYVQLECTTGSCPTNSLRLVGGSTEREGRVEVCVGNRWRTVCTDNSQLLAGAVCSQLGYIFEESAVSAVDTFPRGTLPEYRLNCVLSPTEGWLCQPIMEQCSSPVELGVVCKNYEDSESSMETITTARTTIAVDVSACTSDVGLISVVVILTVSLVATLVALVITCAVLIKNHKQRLLANETCEEVVVPNTAANPAYMTVTSNNDNHTYDVINDVMASKQRRGN